MYADNGMDCLPLGHIYVNGIYFDLQTVSPILGRAEVKTVSVYSCGTRGGRVVYTTTRHTQSMICQTRHTKKYHEYLFFDKKNCNILQYFFIQPKEYNRMDS